MDKAQNVGQIFIYVLTVVIVGLILLIGYKAISGSRERINQITVLDFQKSMEASITTITNQYGTVKKKTFTLPAGYKEVCFMENYQFNTALNYQQLLQAYPLIYDSLQNGQPTKNIFLIRSEGPGESYDLGRISVSSAFTCFEIRQNMFTVTLEGKGDHVSIS